MSESIVTSLEDGVRTVRMNRPDKKNALNAAMYDALTAALRDADTNSAVRAVIITGTEGCFTAGNDLQDFIGHKATAEVSPPHALILALSEVNVPLVAAVDGVAVGIGTTMLLHCDFVYATRNARLSLPFVNLGVCPEAASSLLLPRQIGHLKAAELLMLGESFDGETALRHGLVSALCDPATLLAQAQATARKLAAKPRGALRATKELLRRAEEPVTRRVDAELAQFTALLALPAAREIMSAFLEKRAPDTTKYD